MLSSKSKRLLYILSILDLLIALSLGFSSAWFSGDVRLANALQIVSIIGFVLLTCSTAWHFKSLGPFIIAVAFGGLYGTALLVGTVCGGHASAFAAAGRLSPASMIVIGLAIYGFVGLLFGTVGGLFSGGIVSILIRLQTANAKLETSAQDNSPKFTASAPQKSAETTADIQRPNASMEKRFVSIVVILSVGLYGLSLLLPAIGTSGGYNQAQLGLGKQNPGFWILILSMTTCFMLNPMWLANPLAWTGAVLLTKRRYRAAAVASTLAAVASLTGVWFFKHLAKGGDQYDLLVGCYLWLASIVVLAAGSMMAAFLFPNKSTEVNAS